MMCVCGHVRTQGLLDTFDQLINDINSIEHIALLRNIEFL